jgi:ribonuclease-3
MTRSREKGLADLEARIGHDFADPALLGRALTHVSASPARRDSYERLEFLGDRVLGLAVAHMLYDAFPNESEGELSRRLRRWCVETCAEVHEVRGVTAMRLGEGEAQTGGARQTRLARRHLQAIIGAAFLDGAAGRT